MNFAGDARRVTANEIARVALDHGYEGPEFLALLKVEASGVGFDGFGRPKMLFEPHKFYRKLDGKKLEQAVSEGLAYPKWGTKPYPRDSYQRLHKAIEIDMLAALESASWGVGQILGENAESLGYADALQMVSLFMDSEAEQIEAVARFLDVNNLAEPLKSHDWEAVARGYNGPGFRKYGYHEKLRRAYEKIANGNKSGSRPTLRLGSNGPFVTEAQELLRGAGFFPGKVDGVFGSLTRRAVITFQDTHGLAADGVVGPNTWQALMVPQRPIEREHTAQTLAAAGSETVTEAAKVKGLAGVSGIGGGAVLLLERADDLKTGLDAAQGALGSAQAILAAYWPTLALIAVCAALWVAGGRIIKARVADARTGRNLGR